MKRLLTTIAYLSACMAMQAQDLAKDVNRVKDFLLNTESITVNVSININYGPQDQSLKGKIAKYGDIYYTNLNQKTVINNSLYNLIVDHNQKMIFIRNSVQGQDLYGDMLGQSLQNMDSVLASNNMSIVTKDFQGGRRLYALNGKENSNKVEIMIGKKFLERIRYEITDEAQRTSTVEINYDFTETVDPSDRRLSDLNTYLTLDKDGIPQLNTKYSSYQLVNNLMP